MLYLFTAAVLAVTLHIATMAIAARAIGVKVVLVSLGYGPTLFQGRGFRIGAIPLGGFVKLLSTEEDLVPASDWHMALDTRPATEQLFVVLSGCCVLFIAAYALQGAAALQAFVALPGQFLSGAASPLGHAQLLIGQAAATAMHASSFAALFALVAAKLAALNFLPLPALNGGTAVRILFKRTGLSHWWPAQATHALLLVWLAIFVSWFAAVCAYGLRA